MTDIEFTKEDIDDIQQAMRLRIEADKTGDPALYRQAFELFKKKRWYVAAALCLQKAEYYEAQL